MTVSEKTGFGTIETDLLSIFDKRASEADDRLRRALKAN